MARKRTASAETLKPDPRYNSKLASKFINCLMWEGKKATAQRIFYGALDQIKKRMPEVEPIDVFTQAVEHIKPTVEVRSKRVGGATYQVPMQVNRTRQQSLAIRWLIGASRSKKKRKPRLLTLHRWTTWLARSSGHGSRQACCPCQSLRPWHRRCRRWRSATARSPIQRSFPT